MPVLIFTDRIYYLSPLVGIPDIGLALLVFLENGEIDLRIPLLLQSDIGLDGPLAVFEFLCFYSKKLFGV